MTADPHIATIQAALHRERLHIEMSDLDKGHEAREFARIDAALAWFDAPDPTAQHIATIRVALNSRRSFWVDLLAKLNETDYDSQELKDGIAEWRKELADTEAALQALDAPATPRQVDDNGLLPCPFCGWANPVWEVERHAYDWIEYAAYCANCDAMSKPSPTKEEAAEAWNRRTTTPATVDGVPDDVLHWLDVVTTAILDRHEQYSPAIGIAASALVDWMLEQRRAVPRVAPGTAPGAMPAPDWSQAPEWANYWTRDTSGITMWWETKPFYDGRYGFWMCEDETLRVRATDLAVLQQRPHAAP